MEIIHNMRAGDYHSRPELNAHTVIDAYRMTNTKFLSRTNHSTPAMDFGSAYHKYVLEWPSFFQEIAVVPNGRKRPTKSQINAKKPSEATQKEIAFWEDFDSKHAGKIMISMDQFSTLQDMQNRINHHKASNELLSMPGKNEVTCISRINGIDCRGRADRVLDDGTIIDLKTCRDAGESGVRESIVKYCYHAQAWFYIKLFQAKRFVFIFQETEHPYDLAVYECGESMIAAGEDICTKGMSKIERWKTMQPTGYHEHIKVLECSSIDPFT